MINNFKSLLVKNIFLQILASNVEERKYSVENFDNLDGIARSLTNSIFQISLEGTVFKSKFFFLEL